MGAQRSRPQTAVRSANHPARSSAVAIREPGLVDGITRLQQTAGNRATAARLVAIQRDAAKQPGPGSSVNPDYDRVYKGYWSLMQDLMRLNAKVVSLIRTDWTDDLGRGLTELGDPATAKPAAIAALQQRLTATRGNIEAEVAAAKAEWKSLWAEYKQERDGWSAARRPTSRPCACSICVPRTTRERSSRRISTSPSTTSPGCRRCREQDPRPVGHPPGRDRVPAAQEGRDGQAAALQQLPDPHPRGGR